MDSDRWFLKDEAFESRLLLGTGKFSGREVMLGSIEAAKTELVTVALRRHHHERPDDDLFGPLMSAGSVRLMPNTSGARTAEEAILAARIGREISGSPFVKVEIHPNPQHLLPDPIETFAACRVLAAEGFIVLPYIPADPVLARRLEDVGCAAVMPLGSAIGSGNGLATRLFLDMIIRDAQVPVIVDAGLRSPSEAAAALEMGCTAVLVNSAVAGADDPIRMARAFNNAVCAGREAYLAGLMIRSDRAVASSPLTLFLDSSNR